MDNRYLRQIKNPRHAIYPIKRSFIFETFAYKNPIEVLHDNNVLYYNNLQIVYLHMHIF